MEMSVANISQHLQVLRNAKLVEAEREGNRVQYRLTDESVMKLWLSMRTVAEEHLPEIGILRQQNTIEGLGDELPRSALESIVGSGDLVLIDVRPSIEYEAGHISGAVSIPIDQLPQQLAVLPKDKKIVAYCRGEYCLFADEAVAFLLQHGFDAVRLEGGWPEWHAEGRA
jgi:rhodanese-related sulfurtransferase